MLPRAGFPMLVYICAGTQALVRAGSNHSSLSAEENIELSPAGRSLLAPQLLCRARALLDFMPSIYEKDALRYKVGSPILNSSIQIQI